MASKDAGAGPISPQVDTPAEDAGALEPDEPDEPDAAAVELPVVPDAAIAPDDTEPPRPSMPVTPPAPGGPPEPGPPGELPLPMEPGPSASCAGAPALGLCWYLANPAASCEATCAAHGGPHPRAPSLIGTSSQGGRLSNCRRVLLALGVMQPPVSAQREDNYGLGCHIWSNGESFWLDDPSPRFVASAPGLYAARVSCGCVR